MAMKDLVVLTLVLLANPARSFWAGRPSAAPRVARRTPLSMTASDGGGGELNKYSSRITQPKAQGASQAMLYATGLEPDDLNKAQVGVGSVWYDGNPCNMHLLELGTTVRASVQEAGLVGYRFNTIGVSDGISMGTTGMRYSLQSRDLIADSMEVRSCARSVAVQQSVGRFERSNDDGDADTRSERRG